MLRALGAISLPVLAAFALGACSSSTKSSTGPTTVPATQATTTTLSTSAIAANVQARKHVTISSCGPDSAHDVEIQGTVLNVTTSRSSYVVQLTISDKSGRRLYATAASANDVEPQRSAHWAAPTKAKYVAGMTCSVTSVSRRPV